MIGRRASVRTIWDNSYPGVRGRILYSFRTRTQVRVRKVYGVRIKSDIFGTEKERTRNDFENRYGYGIFFIKLSTETGTGTE